MENIIKDKSFEFAVAICTLYKNIIANHKDYVLGKQILRSGTSVGANVREAHNSESKADFIHKLAISQKECDETRFWLELLFEIKHINQEEFNVLHNDATEILKILKSIISTTKQNLKSGK